MLLTITTTHRPATDLGYLLHKHPGRFQSYDLSFGKAHAFYVEATEDRCSACLLLDVDPGSGSSPKRLHGLPSGTGPENSAVAERETVVFGSPRRGPKKLSTVVSTLTRSCVAPARVGVTETAPPPV